MTRFLSALILLVGLVACTSVAQNPTSDIEEEAVFEIDQLFDDERFPNVVVATDGTVLATWGGTSPHSEGSLRVRRSEDGGVSWGPEITVADPIQWHGGGTVVDENTRDILLFAEKRPLTEEKPGGQLAVYRSTDHGQTWEEEEVTIHPDEKGNIPSMHINERGITLQHGPHAGRLLRATRDLGSGNEPEHWPDHYTNAMYSDDGGETWHTSAPFPAKGTGEAALEELSEGRIYYNSRRHLSTDGLTPYMRHIAWSYDGGETWEDLSVSEVLPDGPQSEEYGLMAGLVRLPIEGHDILLFSNVDSEGPVEGGDRWTARRNGTVWASFDGGETWPVKRLVDENFFAYSSMAAGRPGTESEGLIHLLYESRQGGKIARFNLDWLTEGRDWREFIQD